MPEKNKENKIDIFPLHSLYGSSPAEESIVLNGMSQYGKSLNEKAESDLASWKQREAHLINVYKPMRDIIGNSNEAKTGITGLRKSIEGRGKDIIQAPDIPNEKQRIYSGSIGAKVVPPYGYDWVWIWEQGNASPNVQADRTKGSMYMNLEFNLSEWCTAKALAGVGIYFRPALENGILRVRTNISYSDHWMTDCVTDSCESEGFAGLRIDSFNHSTGKFNSTVYNKLHDLYYDSSWWRGVGEHKDSNSAYPLSAEVDVDWAHFYIIWVMIGGSIVADGPGNEATWWSAAYSVLSAKVPSINWELF